MKQYIYLLLFGGMFLLMLLFPSETFSGATSGLLLWFQIILPTLLPFIILSNLLIHTNCVKFVTQFFRGLFCKIFSISPISCYAVLVGFLCGYPMGAKVIADLVSSKYISLKEGQYLLSFCNNTSPMFLISYVILQHFQDKKLLIPSILILYFTPILCSFVFRKIYTVRPSVQMNGPLNQEITFDFLILDHSIMNGFETITKIGGYMIIFSVLFSLGSKFPFSMLLPFLELTNGITIYANSSFPFLLKYVLCLALTSFGGLCAIAQTNSMIQETELRILPYIKTKLITAMVTSFFAYIYITIILQ